MHEEPLLGTGRWIGVDLDRTLAHYDTFNGDTSIGEPIKPMVDLVKSFINKNYDVRIFTARVCPVVNALNLTGDVDHIVKAIQYWCMVHIGKVLPVTCMKDYGMVMLYDDRATGVVPNTGQLTTLECFKEGANFVLKHCSDFMTSMVVSVNTPLGDS